jgi:hypothetical protein
MNTPNKWMSHWVMLKSEKSLVSQRRSKQNDPRPLPSLTFRLDLGRAVRNSAKLVEPKSDDSEQSWRIVLPNLYWEFWLEQQKLRSKWSVALFSPSICCLQRFPRIGGLTITKAMQNFRFVGWSYTFWTPNLRGRPQENIFPSLRFGKILHALAGLFPACLAPARSSRAAVSLRPAKFQVPS